MLTKKKQYYKYNTTHNPSKIKIYININTIRNPFTDCSSLSLSTLLISFTPTKKIQNSKLKKICFSLSHQSSIINMSSHTNLPSPKPIPKPDHRLSTPPQPKKPPSSSSSSSLVAPPSSQDQTLKCPRCNSPNTKFCYYNNYSLTQPRHFCKSCRRYWTRGGALRNVPIGGGCRKTKKSIKPNNSSSSSMINTTTLLHHPPPPTSSYSSQRFISSLMEQDSSRFFPPPPPLPPTTTMDFQLSSLSLKNDLSSSSYQNTIPVDVGSGLSLMGFGDYTNNNNQNYTTAGEAVTTGGNLASSIETLSCLNQDLHWRLQQQRMAMFFGSKDHQESVAVERPQPILYRNLDIVSSSPPSPTRNQTEWYFGNNSDNEGVISNNDTGGGGGGGNSNDQWNNGIQAWTDLNHYNALP